VAGRRGAVMEDDFYNKLKRLSVQTGKKDKTHDSGCALVLIDVALENNCMCK